MALKALSEWGKEKWPANVVPLLEQARLREPDEEVPTDLDKLTKLPAAHLPALAISGK